MVLLSNYYIYHESSTHNNILHVTCEHKLLVHSGIGLIPQKMEFLTKRLY